MAKKLIFVLFIFVSLSNLYAQSPLSGDDRYNWKQQEGYALVEGVRIHYWLYNTYAVYNGNWENLSSLLHQWVERLGWVIDYDNAEILIPNKELARSVKSLMASRNCDVAVTILENNNKKAFLIINCWDWEQEGDDAYWTEIYPLLK